jgi:hypothetical protein
MVPSEARGQSPHHRFYIALYKEGPPYGKLPSEVDEWRGTRVGPLKPADAARRGEGVWEFLPGELDVPITEHFDAESIWVLYERPDSQDPASYSRVGRELEPGDVFTVPLDDGCVANLTLDDESEPPAE